MKEALRASPMRTSSLLREELDREINREVEEVLVRARQQAESLLADAHLEQEHRLAQAGERLRQELVDRRRRALSRAELEGRNSLLQLKRELLDQVLAALRERYLDLARERPERLGELLWTFYLDGRRLLPRGPVRVRVGREGGSVRDRLAKEENAEVVNDERLHGLVMENTAGTIRCDYSLDAMLQRLRAEREADIESLLFGESHGSGKA
jgi:vacuolar-type H+-ATPase subunit E/Vma4